MSTDNQVPYGYISVPEEIGLAIRQARKQQGVTQAECAALCGVGVRFISNLENGKHTAEIAKVMQVLHSLGLELAVLPRNWKSIEARR
jgi:y4mF family transcriptional regulator